MSDTAEKPQKSTASFDELMRAAVGIKTAQLDSKKRMFEKLPNFLKAGVYYNSRLENVRKQRFRQQVFVYELLKSKGAKEFKAGEVERALHRYEEALCIWRYYICSNPNWEKDGIDDDEIEPVEKSGDTPEEELLIKDFKLQSYLNIGVCSLKTKDYYNGVKSLEEALKLSPNSVKALYLRARCRITDINSGVDELKLAIQDLKAALVLEPNNKSIADQLNKVQKQVNVNHK